MNKKILKSIKKNKYYILIFAVVCIITGILFIILNKEIIKIDNSITNYIKNNYINDNLVSSMKFITEFGDKIIFICIILLMFIFIKNKKYSVYMSFMLVITLIFNYAIKNILKRNRPSMKLIEIGGYSFPSGHAMCSTAFYGLLLYFMCKSTKKAYLKIIYSLIIFAIIILISFSRVYLMVHYFIDVLVGIILGIILLIVFIKIIKELEDKSI